MSRNLKRLAALVLPAVMAIGPFRTIYASEPRQDQASEAHIPQEDDRIQVVLPTDAVGIFDFILDPQELIYQTNALAYDGQTFEEGATLFFKRSDGEVQEDYSSTSDAVTITNTGSAPIDVVITAGIAIQAKDGFAMTDDREFTEDTRPSVYLALTDGETEVPIMGEEEEETASLNITIPPAIEGEPGNNEYSFRLTGAANKEGDWSRMKNISFELMVTWVVDAQEEEMPLENEETNLPDMPKEVEITDDSGEKIVRKKVPVVSDSNVIPDDVKSEIVPTEGLEDGPEEKETPIPEETPAADVTDEKETNTVKENEENEETAP